jgi:hypothetical protein
MKKETSFGCDTVCDGDCDIDGSTKLMRRRMYRDSGNLHRFDGEKAPLKGVECVRILYILYL